MVHRPGGSCGDDNLDALLEHYDHIQVSVTELAKGVQLQRHREEQAIAAAAASLATNTSPPKLPKRRKYLKLKIAGGTVSTRVSRVARVSLACVDQILDELAELSHLNDHHELHKTLSVVHRDDDAALENSSAKA